MSKFWRHVLRSGIENYGSLIGAACIIALGIFVYVAMMDTLKNLDTQVEDYYQESSLADVFATVEDISLVELELLREIPGIAEVSGKMAVDVRMLAEGQREIVTVHLLSYDETDAVNRIYITGDEPHDNGIYLGSKMMEASGYELGDELILLINGTGKKINLQGLCNSAEYISLTPPSGAILPDGEVYDIACVDKKWMQDFTGRRDSYQELGFRLMPGYSYEDVRYQLTDMLTSKGLTLLCDRQNQMSYDDVDGEKGELRSIATLLSAMFFSISVFLQYIILKKMVERDQSVIGTMKALGMKDVELFVSYMAQGLIVGFTGAVIGCILARPFGKFMFTMYAGFFNLPDSIYRDYLDNRLIGIILALAVSAMATYLGVRGILEISPAQAMRSRTPRTLAVLNIPKGILNRLGAMERMGCRSVVRNPFRGFLIVLAVAFPFSMASVLLSFQQVVDQMYGDQFSKVQTYDVQISLTQPTSLIQAVNTGMNLEGIIKSEGMSELTVEISHENRTEFSILYVLNKDSGMWRIMDLHNVHYQPPDDGLILNHRMAEKLNVYKGDYIEVSCTTLTVQPVNIPVVDIIEENFGGGCYISCEGIQKFFNTTALANTILLEVKPGYLECVREQLLKAGGISWVVDTDRILKSYKAQMESSITMINMFALMAVVAGGILIYNVSMINIRERIAELGMIVMMGGTRWEVGRILFAEQILYFILGILAGFPGSRGVKYLVEKVVISDIYTIDLTIGPFAYVKAFLVCLVIMSLAFLAQMRTINKIEMVDILKKKE